MEKLCGVYIITSPTGKKYVGSSIDIKRRFSEYKRSHCKNQPKLINSFNKYGVAEHSIELFYQCVESELLYWETEIGNQFNSINNGLNCKLPGNLNYPISHSEETKIKISLGNKGKIISEETKLKQSKAKKGVKLTDYQKRNFNNKGENNPMFGKKQKESTKKLIAEKNKYNQTKIVLQYDLKGNFIKEWFSMRELCKVLNLNCGNVSRCCNGFLKSVKGFTFKFKKID
jgi:group I intron endonuclease